MSNYYHAYLTCLSFLEKRWENKPNHKTALRDIRQLKTRMMLEAEAKGEDISNFIKIPDNIESNGLTLTGLDYIIAFLGIVALITFIVV